MNSFTFYNSRCEKPGVYSVDVILRDRFLIVQDAGGWRIYSTCDCLLSAHYWPTKRAAIDGLRDFLTGVEEQQLRKPNARLDRQEEASR